MKNTRRELFHQAKNLTLLTLISGSFLPKLTAQTSQEGDVLVDISRNHRHALTLSKQDVLKALKVAASEGSAEFNIQGKSSHPHIVELVEDELMAILDGEEIEVVSSRDAGHTHHVTFIL